MTRDGVENRDKIIAFLRDTGISDALSIARRAGVYIDDVEAILRVYDDFRQVGQDEHGNETWSLKQRFKLGTKVVSLRGYSGILRPGEVATVSEYRPGVGYELTLSSGKTFRYLDEEILEPAK